MANLIMLFCFICLLIAYATGRIGVWLYLKMHYSVAAVSVFTALLVSAVYVLAVLPPYFGTALVALPFAIGFGSGKTAGIVALVCQGLVTWILSLLFFRGICWLKKYDEAFNKTPKQQ